MLRFLTAGESHGKGCVVIVEGMPANVPISVEKINEDLSKRQKGAGSGKRMTIETDVADIISGVRNGKTIGSPITIYIENKDYKNWKNKTVEKVENPRPGHADLAGVLKYGFDDVRNVLERASARETVCRVAAGSIFRQFLSLFDIKFASHTISIGNESIDPDLKYSFKDIEKVYKKDPEIRSIDKKASLRMRQAIETAKNEKNTLGGIVEVWAMNIPPGLGSYVHYDKKIDGHIVQALMSIPSVKAVEIGKGIVNSTQRGSEVHDEIYYNKKNGYHRKTNNAGGIEGGVTNGMPVVARLYHKPISTLYEPLNTVNIKTKKTEKATIERSDVCVVPRAGVIGESMLAYVITEFFLEKFGSDDLSEIKYHYQFYTEKISYEKSY